METSLKLTAELASDIRARAKTFDFDAIEKIKKAKDDNGTFDVIISTEDTDRSGEIVKQNGWELANYKNNPIVLWGHDYYSLPVGVCLETYLTEKNGVPALGARGVFLSAEINPYAQQVRKLYEFGLSKGAGVGCTTSVGFIPKEFDENARNTITKAELLEFSFVPVPANQGVGAARTRALTIDEAKSIGLDIAGMTVKGLQFSEKAEIEQKEAQAGDSCEMDDGSAGILATDEGGALVCMPTDEKAADDGKEAKKALLKSVGDEHERHVGEMDKSVDDFAERAKEAAKPKDGEDQDTTKGRAAMAMRESIKELKAAVQDEHTMHRANSVGAFRNFEAPEKKAMDKNKHLKDLRAEHDQYEARNTKALDEFEDKCTKSIQGAPGETDQHTDWITDTLELSQRAHKKAVTKIAKAMSKDAYGEEEKADEKTLAVITEALTPFVKADILPAVAMRIGVKLSEQMNAKLGEAHQSMKAATAALEALHGGLAGGYEEEGRSTGVKADEGSREPRSRTRTSSRSDDALTSHLQAREIVRGIEAVAREGLGILNAEIRDHSKK